MSTPIFRQVSLDRLSSPEQLDTLMTVTSPRGWIALLACGLLIAAAIGWGLWGTLSTRVNAQGILIKSGGIQQLVAGTGGRITDVRAQPNDLVQKGEVIARIDQPELVEQVDQAKRQLQALQDSGADQEKTAGLRQSIAELQTKLELASRVVSPYSGRVLEVPVSTGEFITPGQPVISMELTGAQINNLTSVFYVPAAVSKQIMPGMDVNIAPSSVQKEQYGLLRARVTSVGVYPVTGQGMMQTLGNQELVRQLAGLGAVVEVQAELIPNAGTFSGYEWSTPQGPPLRLQSGTLAAGSIIIKKQRPLALLFPQFD